MFLNKPDFILNNEKTKCGEIHFLDNCLTLFCGTCEFRVECFIKFKSHFESYHLEQFSNIEYMDLKNVEKNEFNDPLNWILTENPKEKELEHIIQAENTKQCNEVTLEETDKSDTNSDSLNTEDDDADEIEWHKPYQPRHNQIKRPYKPRDKLNTCLYCKRSFRRRAQLDNHVNIHTGAKPQQCERCGKRFRAVTTLQRHLLTHEKNKILESCKFCKKLFAHKQALLSHETRHTQERKFSCDQCEKSFYTFNQCDTHKRRVHHKLNDEQLPKLEFGCDLCTKRYRTASMLSTHKFKKHLKTAKFTCDKCDKKFVDNLQLEEHEKIHVSKNVET